LSEHGLIVVDRGGGPSTEAAAADLGWLKQWKQIEKRPKKAQGSASASRGNCS
jgi:hypothetical protein